MVECRNILVPTFFPGDPNLVISEKQESAASCEPNQQAGVTQKPLLEIILHLSGAVELQRVYPLSADARMSEAIGKLVVPTDDADIHRLNLVLKPRDEENTKVAVIHWTKKIRPVSSPKRFAGRDTF